MKRLFKIAVWTVLAGTVLCATWRMFIWVGRHDSAVVYDGRSEHISGSYLHGIHWTGLRSVWNPPMVVRGGNAGSFSFDCISAIPGSIDSGDRNFSVRVSYDIEYRLKKDFSCSYEDLGGDYIRRCIVRNAGLLLRDALTVRLKNTGTESYPAVMNGVISSATGSLKERMSAGGIDLIKCDIRSASFPEEMLYRALMNHRAASVQQMLLHDLNLRSAEAEMAGSRIRDDYYDHRLEKISLLIEKNPLLLKFIYIDKLGGNVKMILPSGLDGLPAVPDTDRMKGGDSAGRQIDNLK